MFLDVFVKSRGDHTNMLLGRILVLLMLNLALIPQH
jgi:hypothetical protein